ncbi:BQ5605_C002g01636 [Microbotryum silenes-dioicae]|uniref:BQ5605_C002g01636 protein n=1 Tax=Microbotryum silenes-dioicae TaxID=796604 RepID=A0A2X0LZ98_9BASI|nr:BQ5605_C002g01636 [Microbotryum silenes-dioicae]
MPDPKPRGHHRRDSTIIYPFNTRFSMPDNNSPSFVLTTEAFGNERSTNTRLRNRVLD